MLDVSNMMCVRDAVPHALEKADWLALSKALSEMNHLDTDVFIHCLQA